MRCIFIWCLRYFWRLRLPILAGLIGWGLLLLVILALVPDQVAGSPFLRLVTNPLTLEFMMGAVVGILRRKRHMPGVITAGVVGLTALTLSIGYIAPLLSLATSPHLDAWRIYNVRRSVGAADLCTDGHRNAVLETSIYSPVGGTRRLVLCHAGYPTQVPVFRDCACAVLFCPSWRNWREYDLDCDRITGGQHRWRSHSRLFRTARARSASPVRARFARPVKSVADEMAQ